VGCDMCGESGKTEEKVAPRGPEQQQFSRMFWNQIAPELFSIAGMDIKQTDPYYIGSTDVDQRRREMGQGKPLPDRGLTQSDPRRDMMGGGGRSGGGGSGSPYTPEGVAPYDPNAEEA